MKVVPALVIALPCLFAAVGVVTFSGKPEEEAMSRSSDFSDLEKLVGGSGREAIRPLPYLQDQDPREVALGKRLFHDPALSRDGTISCASCHDLSSGGDDGRTVSAGVGGTLGDRNAPTVWNCRFNVRQFWDGRAKSLEEQIEGPLLNPNEMGMSWDSLMELLHSDPSYVKAFQKTFGEPPSRETLVRAIAAFERSLITPDSPFDRYLRGDLSVLDNRARRGYQSFKKIGCIACHQGVNVGGNMLQQLGRVRAYSSPESVDDEGDLGLLKVPSLRNVAQTAPYFHDGSIGTLDEAVRLMGRHQLGVEIPAEEIEDIVLFLESLSGDPLDHVTDNVR